MLTQNVRFITGAGAGRPGRILAGLSLAGLVVLTVVLFQAAERENPERVPGLEQISVEPVKWFDMKVLADGNAFKGPWRMNESEFHYVDDPAVAIGQDGTVAVVWADQAGRDIYLQIYESNGTERLAGPVNVSSSPDIFSWLPRVVTSPEDMDRIYILWQEIIFSGGSHGGEILFSRSSDGGRSFSEPVNLSNTPAGAGKGRLTSLRWDNGSLDLDLGPDETLYAAWTEYEGALRFSRSDDGGETFTEPQRIAGGDGELPARGPSLTSGGEERVYLAWTVGGDEAADIHFTKSADRGQNFEPPGIIGESSGHSEAPRIALDSHGTLHLVYGESPAGLFQHYHINYVYLEEGDDTFSGPVHISGSLPGRFESANYPKLGLDGQDNLYVVWELFPDRSFFPHGMGFTASTDGGQTFSIPSVIPGTDDPGLGFSGSQQGMLMNKLAVNKTGSLAVVNSTFKEGESSHIWLIRGNLDDNER